MSTTQPPTPADASRFVAQSRRHSSPLCFAAEDDGDVLPPADLLWEAQNIPEQHFLHRQTFSHDRPFAVLFAVGLAVLLSTMTVDYLSAETNHPIPGIYRSIISAQPRLLGDTVLAIAVSLLWMLLLLAALRPFLYLLTIAVPFALAVLCICARESLGLGLLFPAFLCFLWIFVVYRRRRSLSRAVDIIQLACRIYCDCFALLGVAAAVLAVWVAFTAMWIPAFARVFLDSRGLSFPLAVYYSIMYLWTWGVLSGIQRATTSAVVAHWYFHRHDDITPSTLVVQSLFSHTLNSNLGTISFSSLLILLTRLPFLVLPRKLAWILAFFLPGQISSLSSPLALVYSSIKSTPLLTAARATGQLYFLDQSHPFASYKLCKMLLFATRGTTACAMAAAAMTSNGVLVGLVAASIGWIVVGAVEGTIGMIVDAVFVCFAIDAQSNSGGYGHCRDAWNAFGGYS
ncbi:Choline transporter-like protein ctl1 [Neolecta irregularis DAH-3]|uniref:Protein PNS1 n=1 Tax=Neolecta irregularis (strain DAH-3) TaxID=1198029 RepID=A0A1U7LTM1_NEOID|nr:Choline transporter-like protein ctl1 [Neolecta irregularis DAH-3]|eukprot:OLL26025.1 Choline transporter-like protein ctl1 [Neolecta irregularis DAH-3]